MNKVLFIIIIIIIIMLVCNCEVKCVWYIWNLEKRSCLEVDEALIGIVKWKGSLELPLLVDLKRTRSTFHAEQEAKFVKNIFNRYY